MGKSTLAIAMIAALGGAVTAQEIVVTSPAGNATWFQGGAYLITWTKPPELTAPVKIRLRRAGSSGTEAAAWNIAEAAANTGSFGPITVPATVPPGDYFVRVRTTEPEVTGDSATLHVAALQLAGPIGQGPRFRKGVADLIIDKVAIDPSLPRARHDFVNIRMTVKNIGTAATSKVCSLAMTVANVTTRPDYIHPVIPWYANNIPRLAPGATVEISSPTITILYAGMYHLKGLIITEGLQAGEENAANNSRTLPFQVIDPPKADLVLDQLTPTDDGRMKIKMHNQGAAIIDRDYQHAYIRAFVNGSVKDSHFKDFDPKGLLKIGETLPGIGSQRIFLEYIWPATGPDGIKLEPGRTYKIRVFLNYNDIIDEAILNNNDMTVVWSMTQ